MICLDFRDGTVTTTTRIWGATWLYRRERWRRRRALPAAEYSAITGGRRRMCPTRRRWTRARRTSTRASGSRTRSTRSLAAPIRWVRGWRLIWTHRGRRRRRRRFAPIDKTRNSNAPAPWYAHLRLLLVHFFPPGNVADWLIRLGTLWESLEHPARIAEDTLGIFHKSIALIYIWFKLWLLTLYLL